MYFLALSKKRKSAEESMSRATSWFVAGPRDNSKTFVLHKRQANELVQKVATAVADNTPPKTFTPTF